MNSPTMSSPWLVAAIVGLVATPLSAQTFDSTSDGSDGALVLNRPDPDPNPNQPFIIDFNPDGFDPPLDADRDNVYHFTTIAIGPDVTVRLSAERLNGPVSWLANDRIVIEGTIDLSGEAGHGSEDGFNNLRLRRRSVAGAGGFGGGLGGIVGSGPEPGLGPGKGFPAATGPGGGAGHASRGADVDQYPCVDPTRVGGGAVYSNDFLVPLVGGSGGAGGVRAFRPPDTRSRGGGGGGAGGGAILLASDISVEINGSIAADGGDGGPSDNDAGGGGSGGAIRIAAPVIAGHGTITARGGEGGDGQEYTCSGSRGNGGAGSRGRVRLEAFDPQFSGSTNPTAVVRTPIDVFLPAKAPSALRVVSVGGVPIVNPTASITSADILAETHQPIVVLIEARNIPLGTVVNMHVVSENAADQVLDSTPLAGTPALSTATVTIPALPPGFSRAFARAEWSEQ